MASGQLLMLEAKAPGIDKWSYGNIKSTVSLPIDSLGQFKDLLEHGTTADILTTVDAGNCRLLVEHGEFTVDFLQFSFNISLQVVIALVGDAIDCTEDETLIMLIGHGMLLTNDKDCAYNKQQKEKQLISFHA